MLLLGHLKTQKQAFDPLVLIAQEVTDQQVDAAGNAVCAERNSDHKFDQMTKPLFRY